MKESIKNHLNKSGKFLIIGKNSYKVARKLLDKIIGGTIYDKVNTLPKETQQTFYREIQEKDKVVVGTIESEIKIPNLIKQNCMILRLKN